MWAESADNELVEQLAGEWSGKFGSYDMTLEIDPASTPDSVVTMTHVKFKHLSSEAAVGHYTEELNVVHLEDVVENGIQDGEYNLTWDKDKNTLKGLYKSRKGKRMEVKLAKTVTE